MDYEEIRQNRIQRAKPRKINTEDSVTLQNQRDSVDINKIVHRYMQTGEFDNATIRVTNYGDATGPQTLQDAIELVEQRELEFEALPSRIRAYCKNNPVEYERALSDEEKAQDLVDLGLPLEGMEPREPAPGPAAEPSPGAAQAAPGDPREAP